MAAFGALKDLDLVVLVDDDIDVHDLHEVEYAIATRVEASKDLMVVPGARGHEYIRVSESGIRAKLIIDATVPFEESARFARVDFEEGDFASRPLDTTSGSDVLDWL
jgi:2,5-furandicarboxylate decarboxylase 1